MIRHLHPDRKTRVRAFLNHMSENPLRGKPLQEPFLGLFSYRMGAWRIIYSIDHHQKKIHVIALGPRETIYEDLAKDLLLKKNS